MNYITSIVQTIRVPRVEEVEKLHSALKKDNRFELKKFEYQHKQIKEKKEVVEEYELVKATLVFNDEKYPESYIEIDYNVDNGNFPGMGEDYNDNEEEEMPWNE